MAKQLTEEALKKVKDDAVLFGEVALLMGVKPYSLASILDRNGTNVNRYEVVKHIADHMGVDPDSIVEEDKKEAVSA